MRNELKFSALFLFVAILTLTGCATNRGIVSLEVPAPTELNKANGKQIYINSVVDERVFEQSPKTQDIPSLGFEGAENATAEIKKRAIGRKRNTYGKALGDILLEDGQTVETVIADALRKSFSEMGYRVVKDGKEINQDTIIVNAAIQKFWAYMTPGFWAITLSSDISTKLEINHEKKEAFESKWITVKSEGKYQIASGSNWMEIIQMSLEKYVDEIKKQLN